MSKHSNKVDEFYATNSDTARWLFDQVADRYETSGKTSLEPCVGGWAFPNAASAVEWTTCDLNVWTDRDPDHVGDFLEMSLPAHDFVITNPPFGQSNKLAHAFLEKAASIAPVVAMIVPSSMGKLTPRLHKLMPLDYKLVFAETCPCQWFVLPDNTQRPVRTHGVIWEKIEGYTRPAPVKPIKDLRTSFFEFCDEGDFAVRVYGDGVGDLKPVDETCGGTWARFKCGRGKQIISLKLIMSFPWRWAVGSSGDGRAPWDDSPGVVPTVTPSDILHWTNCIAVLEGRIPPAEGVDYDDALTKLRDRLTIGLQLPDDAVEREEPTNTRGLRGK